MPLPGSEYDPKGSYNGEWTPEKRQRRQYAQQRADEVERALATQNGTQDEILARLGITNQKEHGMALYNQYGNNGFYSQYGTNAGPGAVYDWSGGKKWDPTYGSTNAQGQYIHGGWVPITQGEYAGYQQQQQYNSQYGQNNPFRLAQFKKDIASGNVTRDPRTGMYYNDPGNDPSKRVWYNQQGQIVGGSGGQGGSAGTASYYGNGGYGASSFMGSGGGYYRMPDGSQVSASMAPQGDGSGAGDGAGAGSGGGGGPYPATYRQQFGNPAGGGGNYGPGMDNFYNNAAALLMQQGNLDLQGQASQLRKSLHGEAVANPIFQYLQDMAGENLGVKFNPGQVSGPQFLGNGPVGGMYQNQGTSGSGNSTDTLNQTTKNFLAGEPSNANGGTPVNPTAVKASSQVSASMMPQGDGSQAGDGAGSGGSGGGNYTGGGTSGGQDAQLQKLYQDWLKSQGGGGSDVSGIPAGVSNVTYGGMAQLPPGGTPGVTNGSYSFTNKPGFDYRNTRSSAFYAPEAESTSAQYNDVIQRATRAMPGGMRENAQNLLYQGLASDLSSVWRNKATDSQNYLKDYANSQWSQQPMFTGSAGTKYGGDVSTSIANQQNDTARYGIDKQLSAAKWGAFGNVLGSILGSPAAGAKIFGSDASLKEDVEDYNSGLKALRKIRSRGWRYTSENESEYGDIAGRKHIGVVAQELEKSLPDAVITMKNGIRMVDPMPILMSAVNAIKELDKKQTGLANRLSKRKS